MKLIYLLHSPESVKSYHVTQRCLRVAMYITINGSSSASTVVLVDAGHSGGDRKLAIITSILKYTEDTRKGFYLRLVQLLSSEFCYLHIHTVLVNS